MRNINSKRTTRDLHYFYYLLAENYFQDIFSNTFENS